MERKWVERYEGEKWAAPPIIYTTTTLFSLFPQPPPFVSISTSQPLLTPSASLHFSPLIPLTIFLLTHRAISRKSKPEKTKTMSTKNLIQKTNNLKKLKVLWDKLNVTVPTECSIKTVKCRVQSTFLHRGINREIAIYTVGHLGHLSSLKSRREMHIHLQYIPTPMLPQAADQRISQMMEQWSHDNEGDYLGLIACDEGYIEVLPLLAKKNQHLLLFGQEDKLIRQSYVYWKWQPLLEGIDFMGQSNNK